MENTILVATASQGVIRSSDNGETWHRIGLGQVIEFDGVVRSLAMQPGNPKVIYAGAGVGLCRSTDAGSNWALVDSPFNGETAWKVAVDPRNPQRIFVGTGAPSRAALWRTLDGGQKWVRAPPEIPEFCAGVNRPRLLAFAYNPKNPKKAWFGLEAGGLFRTQDGGESWQRVDDRLLWDFHTDIHSIHVLPDADETVVVICVNAVYTSRDGGETWHGMLPKAQFGLYYARALATPPNSQDKLLVSISDGTPGTKSEIIVSRDGARSWQLTSLDKEADSCFWGIHVNPGDPSHVVAGTKYGCLYISEDGGDSWTKQWRSFPEISDVLWIPVAAEIKAAHRSDVG
jgi:photosystem II stability/assembly factor-like uncharacterized protein